MAKAPLLTAAQYRRIEPDLPANRRDRTVISAILYRCTAGQSLRDTSEIFGVSRVRLNEWENALEDALPRIMRKLRLDPANQRMWRAGGADWRKQNPGMYLQVTALRLRDFRAALKAD